jgi:glycosyltransferase involved in cell wall biosynthesis
MSRARLNIPVGSFWVTFIGVNDSVPNRKGIPELLMAWQIFSSQHADAILYLHTSKEGNLPVNNIGGVQIEKLLTTFDIDPASIRLADQYSYRTGVPQAYLAEMYSASDVHILPTRGEGFGVPMIEAAACGCPSITTDFASSAELCASGWLIEYDYEWTWQSALNAKPNVASIVDNLERAYAERGSAAYRSQALEFAREYTIEQVMARYGAPLFRDIAERTLDKFQLVV